MRQLNGIKRATCKVSRWKFLNVIFSLFYFLIIGFLTGCTPDNRKKRGSEEKRHLDLGPLSDFKMSENLMEDLRLKVFRRKKSDGRNEFFALSLVCTHQTCIIKTSPDKKGYLCPCHGSKFAENGRVLNGPAVLPLRWMRLAVSKDSKLLVYPDDEVTSDWRLVI